MEIGERERAGEREGKRRKSRGREEEKRGGRVCEVKGVSMGVTQVYMQV